MCETETISFNVCLFLIDASWATNFPRLIDSRYIFLAFTDVKNYIMEKSFFFSVIRKF